MIRYRRLGRTNLQVSEIVFGGGFVGGMPVLADDDTRRRAIRRALDADINWNDTRRCTPRADRSRRSAGYWPRSRIGPTCRPRGIVISKGQTILGPQSPGCTLGGTLGRNTSPLPRWDGTPWARSRMRCKNLSKSATYYAFDTGDISTSLGGWGIEIFATRTTFGVDFAYAKTLGPSPKPTTPITEAFRRTSRKRTREPAAGRPADSRSALPDDPVDRVSYRHRPVCFREQWESSG
jgi:hypothetical protein